MLSDLKNLLTRQKKATKLPLTLRTIFLPTPLLLFYLFIYYFLHNGAKDVRLNKILQINTNKSVIPFWQGNIRSQRILLFQQTVQYRVWMGLTG